MALTQKDVNATYFKGERSHKVKNKVVADNPCVTDDADARDDCEWDCAFAVSQDTLARLAAQSRAHRDAGRTKRINS